MTLNENPQPDKPEGDQPAVAIFTHDPIPLCSFGVLLEVLKVQRDVERSLEKTGEVLNYDDTAHSHMLMIVFRAIGLEGVITSKSTLRMLFEMWATHKKFNTATDAPFIQNVSQALAKMKQGAAAQSRNN